VDVPVVPEPETPATVPPPAPPVAPMPPPPPTPGVPPPPPGFRNLPEGMSLVSTLPEKERYKTKYRLPAMNWSALPPMKVQGTVFGELNEMRTMEKVKDKLETFEEMFKTKAQDKTGPAPEVKGTIRVNKQPKDQVLETNRLRNIAIAFRRMKKSVEEIRTAAASLDPEGLSADEVDILGTMLPKDDEMKKFEKHLESKKSLKGLSDEEKFVYELGKIERLPTRLKVLRFMDTFNEDLLLIGAQCDALVAASSSLYECQGLRKVFEVILLLGNYMNSSRRGPAYGFKIQALDVLLNTRSTDRKTSLMQYIVNLMRERFPEHADFTDEILYLKKAGLISLEQLTTDVKLVSDGFQVAMGELVNNQENMKLRDFVIGAEEKVKQLKETLKMAEETFHKAVKFFGEDTKGTQPGPFFTEFDRLVVAYKKAEHEIDALRKREEAKTQAKPPAAEVGVATMKIEDEGKVKVLDNVGEGTIDELITGMKEGAFKAKVRKDVKAEDTDFGGIFFSTPDASFADFTAGEHLLPDDDFSRARPWLM
jgi:hypothetical protein